ncbi:MAG: NHL repeat-containing protein [Gemmatimonadota bacterium]
MQGPLRRPAPPGCWLAVLVALAGAAAAPAPAPAQENTVGARGPSTLVYPPFRHTYGIHKARTQHLKLFLGGRTVFADPSGMAAVKLAQDDDPDLRGDDFQLTVLGLNSGRGEIIYNSSMQTLAMYGTHGSGVGQFDRPRSIGADVNGNVYVADTGNRRVVRLLWQDRQLRWAGELPGRFAEPWGIAVAPPGDEVYVSDREADQVLRWAPPGGGATSTTAGRDSAGAAGDQPPGGLVPLFPQGLPRPTALAVLDRDERWLRGKEDALFVVYEDGARLGKFDFAGRPLASVAAAERETLRAPPRFAHVATDFYGNVYVTDSGNGTIYKYTRDLTFLTRYGEQGEGEFQLDEPRGIAIWKRFGQIFVAEREGAQYFFVGTDVRLPDGPLAIRRERTEDGEGWAFDAFFTEPTELSVSFLAADGSLVDSLSLRQPLDSGAVTVRLEGSRTLVPNLAARAATIVLEPKPTYSSRKRFARRIEREIEWHEDS